MKEEYGRSTQVCNNIAIGQLGSKFEKGTEAHTNLKICAFFFVEDTTFTTLTPNQSIFPGTSGGNGDDIEDTDTFYKGTTLLGQWVGFQLNSGKVIAYYGKFE